MGPNPVDVAAPVVGDELAARLRDHVGQWVAIDGPHLVAVGDSARDVFDAARAAGHPAAAIWRVPDRAGRIAYYRGGIR